ncbi:prolyl oligopeptidase family serine peptidase [Parabacteroides distasonis]|uniref:Prolyl oligopeptidase family serine peptidase n=1 Tax=Parabacteroides distasonis TaxID=823 RepID=A0A7K0HHW7_PARDI|nr:prolyl oligopeptidase family serine peptidase [Parabacteroides distasonis]MCB7022095.1 prolyl oligopeptidase family serine peptidase [Parabacteroides distasonis]MCI6134641.1 prolyl oligopeptidase family serine peptidase [Parabacteroides distasonis]MDY5197376.1 prolyl oligopeptidase family serine peptidase [Parabacteroides distasonis]MRY16078.1 prolyl oligopeptidase family serine peptidase [Parabacteroides distasonis]MRY25458.1 prolyl oligopeptidase family serine peptidase [Parabacteroides d
MRHLKYLAFVACLGSLSPALAQNASKSLTIDDLVTWQRITDREISDNGKWVACKMEPWEGDATVYLYAAQGQETATFSPADKFAFSASSGYLVVTQTPGKSTVDSLKILKTKEDKMPMNTLVIYSVAGKKETIDSLKTFKLADEADWIAYQRGRKDSTLYVRSLDGSKTFQFPTVTDFQFAKKSGMLYYTSAAEGEAGIFTLNPEKGSPALIKEGKGVFKQTTFDEKGERLAFLYCADKDSSYKALSLWLSEHNAPAKEIATRGNKAFPAEWVINENGMLQFSKSASRLFFGTSPEPRQKDTTQLAENRPNVQVWSWDEPVQYTIQNYNKEKDLKKSYQAVYNLGNGSIFQLANEELPNIQLGNEGDAALALLSTSRPYSLSSMWEARTRSDYYTVSLDNGERKQIAQADYGRFHLSPQGKYAYWYGETDSCWYTIALAEGKRYRLTTPESFPAWDEENDVPNHPYAHGAAGWTANDQNLLIYDRYDIWKFDPTAATSPINLTVNGRKEKLSYRLEQLDKEARFIDLGKPQLLKGFNETTKGYGFYNARLSAPAAPKTLLAGNYMLRSINKAKNTDDVIYTMETFQQYPDIHYSTLAFKKSVQLTHGDKQQEGFIWGTAELVSWISLDGRPLEGVVYKPANFDPNKKYPMMVNFYERNSETLYNYRMPEPHRSTIDYHLYNSNEYIIFNPDIRYVDGYPGESCYNCLMPGITMMIAKGYIDEKGIGAQGHSWGGYQVAYLATRTNLFSAIESGAPVVNMFSAYGGIRWGSGMARSFQYEHTQSRLGATPWSSPLRYLENSPLFTMDKVQTPILIMHNDADGHVPWYQGIEYFVAMKRLGKPCWLLNYTGEPHWPMHMANRIDFQRRMFQFFNHYLKNQKMPKWMSEGVPAVEQPFELGY